MKKFLLALIVCSLSGADSNRSTVSGSRPSSTERRSRPTELSVATISAPDRMARNIYTSEVVIVNDGAPVYITINLESIVHISAKKVEFVMKLWESDKLLTTKKVSVSW